LNQVDQRITQVEQRINQRIDQLELHIEKVETNLLTAFHGWASPLEAKLRSHSAVLRALDLQDEWLDARVKKLEGTTPS
jgi:hypothetical protein